MNSLPELSLHLFVIPIGRHPFGTVWSSDNGFHFDHQRKDRPSVWHIDFCFSFHFPFFNEVIFHPFNLRGSLKAFENNEDLSDLPIPVVFSSVVTIFTHSTGDHIPRGAQGDHRQFVRIV